MALRLRQICAFCALKAAREIRQLDNYRTENANGGGAAAGAHSRAPGAAYCRL